MFLGSHYSNGNPNLITIAALQLSCLGKLIQSDFMWQDVCNCIRSDQNSKSHYNCSFTIELPGEDRNGRFFEFELPPSNIKWVNIYIRINITYHISEHSNQTNIKYQMGEHSIRTSKELSTLR